MLATLPCLVILLPAAIAAATAVAVVALRIMAFACVVTKAAVSSASQLQL